jgi:hypothetical protein
MSERDRQSRGRSSSQPSAAPSEADLVAPHAEGERGWPLRDPMRLVRHDREQASAQLQRSLKAWRKPSAGAQPKIFLSKKKSGGEDWANDPTIVAKIAELQLPTGGTVRFVPKVIKKNGKLQIERAEATAAKGNARGKSGWLDVEGRIWIRNYAHAGYPDHWDVQINLGADYINVTLLGEIMTKDDQKKDQAPKPGDGFGAGGKK